MSDLTDGVRECRCGMKIDADVAAMINHVTSDEHAQRLAEKGLERATSSVERFPEPERN